MVFSEFMVTPRTTVASTPDTPRYSSPTDTKTTIDILLTYRHTNNDRYTPHLDTQTKVVISKALAQFRLNSPCSKSGMWRLN